MRVPCRACVLSAVFLFLWQNPQTVAAECNPSSPTPQQCSGNGECVRAAVSAEDHASDTEAFTCRCYSGFYGIDCKELDDQAAKLAGESDGYRVVRRTTIIHHRSPYVHPAVVPAVVPMPMFIPAPVAPAPVIVDDPYHSSTVVYTHSEVSWVPILIMSLIAIGIIIAIIICCCAAGNSQTATESVVYSNGYQQPFLADQGTTVTVVEETYDDGKGPQPQPQYQQQQPQQQSNVVYPTQVTAPTGQVIYQQPAPPTGYQYVANQQPTTQMYQNGLHPQTQSVPITQQAPSFPQPTAPPAFNPEVAGTRQ